MKQIIINDVHCGSPIELMTAEALHDAVNDYLEKGRTVRMLGDNIDLTNCDRGRVAEFKQWRNKFKILLGRNCIDGNHEACAVNHEVIKDGDVCYTHYDFEKWGVKRAVKYRSKDHGASNFKRRFIVPLIEWAEQFGVNRATRKFKNNAAKTAKLFGCNTIVGGHIHVKSKLTIKHNGVTIIVLPRGINEVEL